MSLQLPNALFYALSAYYLVASAILHVTSTTCPITSGTLSQPTVTIPGLVCDGTPVGIGSSDMIASILWNTGTTSTVNFTETIQITELGISAIINPGVVTSGLFESKTIFFEHNAISFTDALGCTEENPLAGDTGLAVLYISNPLYLLCLGNATFTFSPPVSTTPQTVTVTFGAQFYYCFSILGCA